MKQWTIGSPDKSIVNKLVFGCSVTSLTAAALVQKGYSSPESVIAQLNVTELSDPFLIKDMETAADTINSAIDSGKCICIYGDYDCDGIISTVMLYSYLIEAGADVTYYIPERSEGYGLNTSAIDKIADGGSELIITVDNGISAIPEAEYIYEKGLQLVVTDHHQQGDSLPHAEAVVDPHRHDCMSPFKHLCGAGVVLKLIAALDGGDYTMALEQFADLAAIATIADVVSLTSENRFLVSYGLGLINNSDRPSVIALKEVSGLNDKKIDSYSVAFGLAPRINAAGRFGTPNDAAKLFLCEDYDEALTAAQKLDTLNNQRKETENAVIDEIYSMINNDPMLIRGRVIFICGKNWHHGVIGIIASRLMESFGKPCFIASENNGEIRGSARSFGKFSIFEALSAASSVLDKFGGHPAAGGFTIAPGKAADFKELLEKYALEDHKIMPVFTLNADAPISPQEIDIECVRGLSVLEPFGTDNDKPLFFIENALITDIIPLSNGAHTKLMLKIGISQTEALMFRTRPDQLFVKKDDRCDLIVSLDINEFRGNESVSVIVNDIRLNGFQQSQYFAAKAAFEAFTRNEELPPPYYKRMLPSRDDAVRIYKAIPPDGINFDTLYIRLHDPRLNFCIFSTVCEALRQLGLININFASMTVSKVKVNQRSDLNSAPILVSLRNKIDAITGKTSASTH